MVQRYGESWQRAQQVIALASKTPPLTQREIARRTGVARSQVQRILAGLEERKAEDRAGGLPYEEPEVSGWRPDLTAWEKLEAERDDYKRRYEQMLADNLDLVRQLGS